jgi:hypothetical protein
MKKWLYYNSTVDYFFEENSWTESMDRGDRAGLRSMVDQGGGAALCLGGGGDSRELTPVAAAAWGIPERRHGCDNKLGREAVSGSSRERGRMEEDDENIASSDMTILVTSDSKVKWFFIMSICNTFDELMLHHDVCSISFSEVLTWIKESIECLWKARRTKYVDWGWNPTPPQVSPQDHHVTFHPRKQRDKFQYVLESLIQTAEQYKPATAATTSYGLHLWHINTC